MKILCHESIRYTVLNTRLLCDYVTQITKQLNTTKICLNRKFNPIIITRYIIPGGCVRLTALMRGCGCTVVCSGIVPADTTSGAGPAATPPGGVYIT